MTRTEAASSQAPAAPKSRKGALTRARLLDAAKEVFEEDGFLEARITDIAERADLSHGSFYHYFDSKEQIFREVAEAHEARLIAPDEDDDHAGDALLSDLERIRRANRRYLERYRDHSRMMAVIEEVSRYDSFVNEARRRRQDYFAERATLAIVRLQQQGRADPTIDPELTALALGAMVRRFAELWLVEQWKPFDFDETVDQLTRLWANAIGYREQDGDEDATGIEHARLVTAATAAELFRRNSERDDVAAHFEDHAITYRELAIESLRRAASWDSLRDGSKPPHIGVLLDNTPEYLFWLGAAAISRSAIVGINATYHGAELARLVDHSECQVLVTSESYADVLDDAPTAVPADRVLWTGTGRYADLIAAADGDRDWEPAAPDDVFLLIFTSGSTGFPKAVQCTQGRFATTGRGGAAAGRLEVGKAVYAPLPMFHSSALFTGLASALSGCVPFGTRSRFSASSTMPDIRRIGATMLAYTGKVLNYILAVPPSPDDASSPLELALGNEASEADIRAFAERFRCRVRDSYGSTEGLIIIRRDESMPPGALGKAGDSVAVYDPETGKECPRAQLDADGRLVNAEAAVEIVDTSASDRFEGYFNNEEALATKVRDGIYWSGDLAYRDRDGWFYFAGRSNEWLRVDGENFSAASVERIAARHPAVRSVAVYAVPDDRVGDRVMIALEVQDPDDFDVDAFDSFLVTQPDLGTKWAPTFVRISAELPKLASMKLDKTTLRRDAWNAPGVWWRPARGERLRPITETDVQGMAHLLPERS